MGDTSIQWTNKSWNPIRARNVETEGVGHYCEKVSPGCAGCYAERMQPRFKNKIRYNAADREKVELFLDEDVLTLPLRWREPKMVFPCSMTDMFGEFVLSEWIDRMVEVMYEAKRHTFQITTKRAERLYDYVSHNCWLSNDPLPNVWLGVSVENQKEADERIPPLLETPAAVRWISAEPLLSYVDLEQWVTPLPFGDNRGNQPLAMYELHGTVLHPVKLDWVVVGGESGAKARPCDISSIRAIVEQCKAAGVACFVKQLGAKPVGLDTGCDACDRGLDLGPRMHGLDCRGRALLDPKGGDISEWPEDLRVREFPQSTTFNLSREAIGGVE